MKKLFACIKRHILLLLAWIKRHVLMIQPKRWLLLTVAGIINAIGVTIFLGPVNLYDSGISGLSMLLSQLTPDYLPLSLFLAGLNIPIFIYGTLKLSPAFTLRSMYAVIVYSTAAWLITDVLPVDVSMASPLAGTDLLLCAIFGGLISGIGSGLTMRAGGAIDGMDVISTLYAKKLGLSVGSFTMCFNVVLYICCGIFIKNWILPLYSVVTYMAGLKTVDFVVEGMDRQKCAMIVTNKPDEVTLALVKQFGHGATRLEARGGFSGADKALIMFTVHRFMVTRMQELVFEVDPTAYITLHEITDVYKATKPLVK